MASSLFSSLVGQSGEIAVDSIAGKTIGLYFSAHWCPPCRRFTPELAKTYNKIVGDGKPFEVIFVSADKNQESFDEYFAEQPWKAVPFADREKVQELSQKFGIQGYPTLIILNEAGEVITEDGRSAVSNDPTGEDFPWIPPTFEEALGDKFLQGDGSIVGPEALEGKTLGLYFSAHWCPPCRGFTPLLAATYKKLKAKGTPFEIVFCSSDRSPEDFQEYFSEMPWMALPYDNRKGKQALSDRFGIRGIPSLVILDAERNEITRKATGRVRADPEGAEFPWTPKPVSDLAAEADGINDKPSLVVLMDGAEGVDTAAVIADLTALGEEVKAAGQPYLVFYATQSEGPVGRIRELTKQTSSPAVVMLDIPDRGGYYVAPSPALDAASIRAFAEGYQSKSLSRQQLG